MCPATARWVLFEGVGTWLGAVHGKQKKRGVMLAWDSRPKGREISDSLGLKYGPPNKGVAELVSGGKSIYPSRTDVVLPGYRGQYHSLTPRQMAIATAVSSPHVGLAAGICAALFLLFILLRPIFDPLRRIPGPFLARHTRLWLFKEVWFGTFPSTNVKLHKRYGTMEPPSASPLPADK